MSFKIIQGVNERKLAESQRRRRSEAKGTRRRSVSFSGDQYRELKRRAELAGLALSRYIAEQLGLPEAPRRKEVRRAQHDLNALATLCGRMIRDRAGEYGSRVLWINACADEAVRLVAAGLRLNPLQVREGRHPRGSDQAHGLGLAIWLTRQVTGASWNVIADAVDRSNNNVWNLQEAFIAAAAVGKCDHVISAVEAVALGHEPHKRPAPERRPMLPAVGDEAHSRRVDESVKRAMRRHTEAVRPAWPKGVDVRKIVDTVAGGG